LRAITASSVKHDPLDKSGFPRAEIAQDPKVALGASSFENLVFEQVHVKRKVVQILCDQSTSHPIALCDENA
jgi:hypothetical protein